MLTFPGFIVRLLVAILVVFGSYNPSGYSYVHWLNTTSGDWALKLFTGLILFFTAFIHLRATWRSMGVIGITLLVLVIVTNVWLMSDLGVVDLGDSVERTLVIQSCLAAILGVGLSWSHIRYRLSGQVDSEDITQ